MARPRVKSLDPEWQEHRKQDRHQVPTKITVRVTAETRARWKATAQSHGLSLSDWIRQIVEQAIKNP